MAKRVRDLTYIRWCAMKQRCFYEKNVSYPKYGGAGISIDPSWVFSFQNFLADMGRCPEGLTLERKDNTKGYSKDNCVWATKAVQVSNRGLFSNSQSGLTGVNWDKSKDRWKAVAQRNGARTTLYDGFDFLEACCARKSWEASHPVHPV